MKTTALIVMSAMVSVCVFAKESENANKIEKILVEVSGGYITEADSIAIKRIRENTQALIHVGTESKKDKRGDFDLTIVLDASTDGPESKQLWQSHASAKEDSYIIRTISTQPAVIMLSGSNQRGMLYAAYCFADLLKTGDDLSGLDLFYEPKVAERYVSMGAVTHGRDYYRPYLTYETLNELPRYGYNGVIIYPGAGTPISRHGSPVLETTEGVFYADKENSQAWKRWFGEIKAYGFELMMAVPPVIPSGFTDEQIDDFYAGGPEPEGYIKAVQTSFKQFLEVLTNEYPELDRYMFNSTEGATFGRNKRFFGRPDLKRFSHESYNQNNKRIMRAYFDVLKEFFGPDLNKVGYWTHSFGLTNKGIRAMREVLFEYPEVMIIEDDYWNNNLWPNDIPSMYYLPEDLRAVIHTKNPFALFQIATDGEYYGGGSVPNAYPGSHIRSAQDAVKRNAAMVIQRLDIHGRTLQGTLFGTMEIVPLAASKQLWSPTPDESKIWQDWANRRFGRQAAPFVISALQESKNILQKGLTCSGIDLLAVGSELNPRLWSTENPLSRFQLFSKPNRQFVQKNENDTIFSEEYTAYQMNTHTISIAEYRKNQNSAMQSIRKGLKEIEKAKPYLTEQDYSMLHGIFTNGANVIEALGLLGEAAYAGNLLISNYDNVKDPASLFKKSTENLEKFIEKEKLIPEINANLREILENYRQLGH